MKCTIVVVALLILAAGYPAVADNKLVKLGSTTSVKTSGLLDAIKPQFEQDTGYIVKDYATGSGKAIHLAREGAFDILLTHAPVAEQALIDEGFAIERIPFMCNYFLLVGPSLDPAGIKGASDVREAFRRIAETKSLFISRADDSGTNKKEVSIWNAIGIIPMDSWYYEAGLGMDAVLQLANDKSAYTLVDEGTWLANHKYLSLRIMVNDRSHLQNTYSLLILNKNKLPGINFTGASVFTDWLLSKKGKAIISSMVIDGEPMFTLISP